MNEIFDPALATVYINNILNPKDLEFVKSFGIKIINKDFTYSADPIFITSKTGFNNVDKKYHPLFEFVSKVNEECDK